jgi:hypothetical protein
MDLSWSSVESQCGSYDFRAWDTLVHDLEVTERWRAVAAGQQRTMTRGGAQAAGVLPYFILDYPRNNCYDNGQSCQRYGRRYRTVPVYAAAQTPRCRLRSQACLDAFVRFSVASMTHFSGRGIIFESVNEPNGMGEINATSLAYVCRKTAAGKGNEIFIGASSVRVPLQRRDSPSSRHRERERRFARDFRVRPQALQRQAFRRATWRRPLPPACWRLSTWSRSIRIARPRPRQRCTTCKCCRP